MNNSKKYYGIEENLVNAKKRGGDKSLSFHKRLSYNIFNSQLETLLCNPECKYHLKSNKSYGTLLEIISDLKTEKLWS